MKKIFAIIVSLLLLSCLTVNTFALEPIIPIPGDGGSGGAGTNAIELPPIVDNTYPLHTASYSDSNCSIQLKVQQITDELFHFRVEISILAIPPANERRYEHLSIGVQGLTITDSSRSGYAEYTRTLLPNGVNTMTLSDFSTSYNGSWAESIATFEIPWEVWVGCSFSAVYEFNAAVTYPSIPLNFATSATYASEREVGGNIVVQTTTVSMSEPISYVPSSD